MRSGLSLGGVVVAGLAAGCMGSGSHGALTADQAIAQAKKHGFVQVKRQPDRQPWRCGGGKSPVLKFGPNPGDPHHPYVRPRYWFLFGDRRAPVAADGSGRVLMAVVVFPTASEAARCARAGIHQAKHSGQPYRLIDGTTVAWGHQPTNFETYISRGQVLASGLAHNAHDSAIVRTDLLRVANQTASG
jgi:hypothetical protein